MLDLAPEVDELWLPLVEAVTRVLRSGLYVLGPEVEAFEREVAGYLGSRYAVGLNSGTDALAIGLRALGVRPGDEVVTTPFTFVATAEAIRSVGAVPVFADIEPATFNIDPLLVEKCITERTRAIVPVHLFGRAAAIDEILRLAPPEMAVVEDTAQAFGAAVGGRKLGTIGNAGAFSFFPSKTLGACGDGGLVVADDEAVAARARALRAHGATRKHYSEEVGYNSRLDELQAAILRLKLGRVDGRNEARRRLACRYSGLLSDTPGVILPPEPVGAEMVFHQYTVRILGGRRERVIRALNGAGIESAVLYPQPLHRLPPYRQDIVLPEAEKAAEEVLSLPLWPSMEEEIIDRVAEVILQALTSSP
jgi:dTDP-4-amino-4,6-dideoxygalactose transaminase